METCPISSVEDFISYLKCEKPQRLCCVHGRGFDEPAVIEHAVRHLSSMCGRVRVVCPNDVCAALMRRRAGEWADVTTIRAFALGIIADERVQAAIGRRPRLLDANEMDVLMEDMKVTGLKHRRLREMLKFFYKSLSDGTARQEGWLITGEEQRQFAVLEENLEARGALLPCEVAGKALAGIEAVPDAAVSVPTVVVDFGALSTLAQELVLATCGKSFVAFGCETGASFADEPYPNYEGLRQLADEDDVKSVALAFGCPTPAEGRAIAPSPTEEFAFVAEHVEALIAKGADPAGILIATPNGIWSRYIAHQLTKRDIACIVDAGPAKVKGDPRDPASCSALEAAALAKLCADRTDMVALRTWLGLGDWLLRSDAFLELLAWSVDHGMSAADAIAYLHAHSDEAAKTRLFYKFEGRLDALETALDTDAEADGTSVDGTGEVRQDGAPAGAAAVTIAPFDRCPGRVADHVFVTGLVNGFLPHLDAVDDNHTIEQKLRACARDRELFEDLKAIARTTVMLSHFEHDAAENAEHLPMDVARIYQAGGTRMARVNASMFLEDEK